MRRATAVDGVLKKVCRLATWESTSTLRKRRLSLMLLGSCMVIEFSEVERPVRVLELRDAARKILWKEGHLFQRREFHPEHLDLMPVRSLAIAWQIVIGNRATEQKINHVPAGRRLGVSQ